MDEKKSVEIISLKAPLNESKPGQNGDRPKNSELNGNEAAEVDTLPPLPGEGGDDISVNLILPPDGGFGWVIAIASFLGNMIVDGVCYTFGVIYTQLLDHFEASKGITALVGALVPATYLIVGPIVAAMCNKFGCRKVAISGSILASFAFVLSAYSPNIEFMLVTYGFLGGVGFGLMYLPAIVMVGHYFDKKRALATGIAVCGSGVGTFVFAPLGTYLVGTYGWKIANIMFGGIILQGCIFGALYRPLKHNRVRDVPKSKIIASIAADKKRTRTSSFDSEHELHFEEDPTVKHIKQQERDGMGSGVVGVPAVSVVTGSTTNLGQSRVSLRVSKSALAASQQSINKLKKDLETPFARKDVLYTGSVTNLKEFKSSEDMGDYVAKVTVIPPIDKRENIFKRFFRITMDMFKFELLKSLTFDIAALAGVLFFFGLYTPFVYVKAKAELELNIPPEQSSVILFILGVCNTVTRLIVGWVADRKWVDLLVIHNVAAILAGLSTCLVAVLNSYVQLCLYAAFFGVNMACFVALRSLVVVELLGVERLNNAFGLVALFQGISVLFGSPISGALVDATGNYFVAFIVFGIVISLGGVVCLPVRRVAKWEADKEERRHEALKSA